MSEMKNKVRWCLKKTEKELSEKGKHRGLVIINPNKELGREHILKAEHYLESTLFLKERFSDISASTVFYSIYHSMLVILAKFGFESRNQECTFAVIYKLIEDGKISIDKFIIDKVFLLSDESIIEFRERFQYGTELSMKEELYEENLEIAKKILAKVKQIIEE